MKNSIKKPSALFWIIGVIALFWNAMGVFAYLQQAYLTSEDITNMTEAEQLYFNNLPAWVMGAFALAVFAGFIGCLLLLLRKKWATFLFILSLIAVTGQFIYNFFIQNYMPVSGSNSIMPIIIVLIAIGLVWFSRYAEKNEWIS